MSARIEAIQVRSRPQPRSRATVPLSWLDRLARRVVLSKLARLRHGQLVLIEGDESHVFGDCSAALPERIVVHVDDSRFYGDIAFGGSIGAGEAYMDGRWRTTQLVEIVRLMVLNERLLEELEQGTAALTRPVQRAIHLFRRNTRAGSRRNIEAHYDLGNEFFAAFLDPSLMYSAAIFRGPATTLAEAQRDRLDTICRKLDLKPGQRVVEIGSGWGGFAVHAARHYGCHVTTTTISAQQYQYTRERVAREGLTDRVQVLNADYRELSGTYDKLVSIEMIEAVGAEYYDTFFAKCAALLEPHGDMFLQASHADSRYERAARSVDFIQRYIFPGSCIPSVSALSASMARTGDLRVVHLQDIGTDYARTLREWRHNFIANTARITALGFDERFRRMWEYYLSYCEGGFLERSIARVVVLSKAGSHSWSAEMGATYDWRVLLAGLAAIVMLALLTWLVSLYKRDVSVVDSMWSLFLLAAGAVYAGYAPEVSARGWLVLTLLAA